MKPPVRTPKLSSLQVIERDQRVAALARVGCSNERIAFEVGISIQMVSVTIQRLRAEWREARIRDASSLVEQELSTINALYEEAWNGWQTSKYGGKKPGDPRFIQNMVELVKRRCELLGLDAPKKNVVEGQFFFSGGSLEQGDIAKVGIQTIEDASAFLTKMLGNGTN